MPIDPTSRSTAGPAADTDRATELTQTSAVEVPLQRTGRDAPVDFQRLRTLPPTELDQAFPTTADRIALRDALAGEIRTIRRADRTQATDTAVATEAAPETTNRARLAQVRGNLSCIQTAQLEHLAAWIDQSLDDEAPSLCYGPGSADAEREWCFRQEQARTGEAYVRYLEALIQIEDAGHDPALQARLRTESEAPRGEFLAALRDMELAALMRACDAAESAYAMQQPAVSMPVLACGAECEMLRMCDLVLLAHQVAATYDVHPLYATFAGADVPPPADLDHAVGMSVMRDSVLRCNQRADTLLEDVHHQLRSAAAQAGAGMEQAHHDVPGLAELRAFDRLLSDLIRPYQHAVHQAQHALRADYYSRHPQEADPGSVGDTLQAVAGRIATADRAALEANVPLRDALTAIRARNAALHALARPVFDMLLLDPDTARALAAHPDITHPIADLAAWVRHYSVLQPGPEPEHRAALHLLGENAPERFFVRTGPGELPLPV